MADDERMMDKCAAVLFAELEALADRYTAEVPTATAADVLTLTTATMGGAFLGAMLGYAAVIDSLTDIESPVLDARASIALLDNCKAMMASLPNVFDRAAEQERDA